MNGIKITIFVSRTVKDLIHGKYINQIKGKVWKVMIWGASLLCSLHAYVLLALGVWVLCRVKADEKFADSKYES